MKRILTALFGLVLSFTLVFAFTGCQKQEEPLSPYDSALKEYRDIIDTLPEGSAYAFVDMGGDREAMLVTKAAFEFEGDLEAAEADVYAFTKDGDVKKYGKVESSTTSMPLMQYKDAVYFGTHSSIGKAKLNESKGKLSITVAETDQTADEDNATYDALFDEYAEGDLIIFNGVEK